MADDSRNDTVEKLLSEEKAFDDRKQALIADLLKQKEAAVKDFDEKLAQLGYHGGSRSGKAKRNHHKRAGTADAASKKG